MLPLPVLKHKGHPPLRALPWLWHLHHVHKALWDGVALAGCQVLLGILHNSWVLQTQQQWLAARNRHDDACGMLTVLGRH